jgi:hypothetical protein
VSPRGAPGHRLITPAMRRCRRLVVALLFASTFVPLNLAAYVALLFVLAMAALVGALLSFLLEVRIAIAALRIGTQ